MRVPRGLRARRILLALFDVKGPPDSFTHSAPFHSERAGVE
jgi:hypothetical protein